MRRVFAFSLIVMASALWIVGAMAQTPKRNAEAQKLKNPEASNAESVESGKKLYARHCASCHGPNGKGDGGMALSGGTPSDLTDDQWEWLQPRLPERTWRPGGPGRPPGDVRRMLNGILYLNKTGCQWRLVPKACGHWSTL